MKKIFFLLLVCTLSMYAKQHFTDKDMDGIPDSKDHCLYTPFSDLVDSKGCTIKTLAIISKVENQK